MLGPKALGLAAIAALAISAAAASTVTATEYNSEAPTASVTAVQENNHVFMATVKVECTSVTAKGEFTRGATSLTLQSIAYAGCKLAGQAATFTMNGCDYKLGQPTGATSPFAIKTITIECPAGKQIEITAPTTGCTIKIPSQTTTGSSTMTNNPGPPANITVTMNIPGIAYTANGGICKTSEHKDGIYTGILKIDAFSDPAHTKPIGVFGT